MPANKKRNRGQLHTQGKKVNRYWIWMFLIGPAVFFIAYWLSAGAGGDKQGQRAVLPQKYRNAGEPVTVNEKTMLAAPGGRVTFTEGLLLENNRVIAEEGRVFMVVPLILPDKSGDPAPSQWYLTDVEGNKYDLLKVLTKNPAGEDTGPGISQGNRLAYLVFKIKKGTGVTFLVYMPYGEDYAAWKMPARS